VKNIIVLPTQSEVLDYVGTLWRSPVARDGFMTHPYTRGVLEDYAKYPRFVFEMSNPELESSHFTSWMNALARRDYYETDGVSDVYYFHEIRHMASMTYVDRPSFTAFFSKQLQNEFEASLASEVEIYLHIPELRQATFNFEIWGDRWLKRLVGLKFEGERAVPLLMEEVREKRKKVMRNPDPFDFLELQIKNYLEQNLAWANIWAKRFFEIESHMADFFAKCDAGSTLLAIEEHLEWLQTANTDGTDIPFYQEAVAFSQVYRANKERYGNQILGKGI